MNLDIKILNEVLISWINNSKNDERIIKSDSIAENLKLLNKDNLAKYNNNIEWFHGNEKFFSFIEGFKDYFKFTDPELFKGDLLSDINEVLGGIVKYNNTNHLVNFRALVDVSETRFDNFPSNDIAYDFAYVKKLLLLFSKNFENQNASSDKKLYFTRLSTTLFEFSFNYNDCSYEFENLYGTYKTNPLPDYVFYLLKKYFREYGNNYIITENVAKIFPNMKSVDKRELDYFLISGIDSPKCTLCIHIFQEEYDLIFFVDFAYLQVRN